MAAWRRKAFALFPEQRKYFEDPKASYYWVFFEIEAEWESVVEAGDAGRIQAFLDFTRWAIRQGKRAPDLENAALVAFVEHMFDDETVPPAQVAVWLDQELVTCGWDLWVARRSSRWREIAEALRAHGLYVPKG